jgi:hypothetical protein
MSAARSSLSSANRAGGASYDVERLMRQYGWDAKLTDLLPALVADCPKRRAVSVYDRCKAVFERRRKGDQGIALASSKVSKLFACSIGVSGKSSTSHPLSTRRRASRLGLKALPARIDPHCHCQQPSRVPSTIP